MEIVVNRITSDDETTISTVSVDGYFVCFGLEDEFREEKVKGETRIPAGVYRIGIRDEGGFHNRYKRKFGSFHKGMLQVKNVPGFEYILIHVGNTDDDTAGCLLLGRGANSTKGDMSIPSSRAAYKEFYSIVIEAAIADELVITYKDSDR